MSENLYLSDFLTKRFCLWDCDCSCLAELLKRTMTKDRGMCGGLGAL